MTTLEKQELHKLRQEVAQLRSFVIGVAGRDAEGEYNPSFVKKVLSISKDGSIGSIASSKAFLKLFS